jgi:glycosyltransferase involved in cell wall biosynthesis
MNIAVVDVAAQTGGALSVLDDFVDALLKYESDSENQWFIFTSVVPVKEEKNIHNIQCPKVKKSWIHRLMWERTDFPQYVTELGIDVVFSLQNNGLSVGNISQLVYFHNVLLLQKRSEFSFLDKSERSFAVYSSLLGPYIRKTWKNVDVLVVQTNSVKTQIEKLGIKKDIRVITPEVSSDLIKGDAPRIKGYIYPTGAQTYKNHAVIINAERKLNEEGKKIDVLFTIDGSENEYAKRILEESKKVKGITCIGKQTRENLYNLYREYGVIWTSRFESFGMPLMEAKVVNTVAVALDYPYAQEILSDYQRGYITKEASLHEVMKKGMLDENITSNQYTQKNGWEEMISLILEMREGV